MYWYSLYGLTVQSTLILPELLPGEARPTTGLAAKIRLGEVGKPSPEYGPVQSLSVSDTEAILALGKIAAINVRRGSEMVVDPLPTAPAEAVRAFVLGPAMGVLLHQLGRFTLHASAVNVNGHVIAFAGGKGAGKSTMAAAFFNKGYPVVADDILAVDVTDPCGPMAFPGIPHLKLWSDASASLGYATTAPAWGSTELAKQSHSVATRFALTPHPLSAIYLLDGGQHLAVEEMSHRDAFLEMVSQSYALRFLGSKGNNATHFRQVAQLAGLTPCFRLRRPAGLAAMQELVKWIEEHVRAIQGCEVGVLPDVAVPL